MSDHAALATHALGLGSATTAASLRAELIELERERLGLSLVERLRWREWHRADDALRHHDALIEACEAELEELEKAQP